MKKITQKDVRAYLSLAAKGWHDQAWHTAMTTDAAKAIAVAIHSIQNSGSFDGSFSRFYKEICAEANSFINQL